MLHHKVSVQQNRFHLCQQRVIAIQVSPARLHHPDSRILKVWNRAPQKIALRDKIRVENPNKFATRGFQSIFQRAGFEARAIGAVNVSDRHAFGGVAFHASTGDLLRFIGRIVEYLHVEQFGRVIKFRDRFNQPLDHVALVENRELDGDLRPLGHGGRRAGDVLAVFVVVVHQPVTMQAVNCQDDEHDEVRDHHHQVERVGVIDAREGSVGQLVPVIGDRILDNGKQGAKIHELPAYSTGFTKSAP